MATKATHYDDPLFRHLALLSPFGLPFQRYLEIFFSFTFQNYLPFNAPYSYIEVTLYGCSRLL